MHFVTYAITFSQCQLTRLWSILNTWDLRMQLNIWKHTHDLNSQLRLRNVRNSEGEIMCWWAQVIRIWWCKYYVSGTHEFDVKSLYIHHTRSGEGQILTQRNKNNCFPYTMCCSVNRRIFACRKGMSLLKSCMNAIVGGKWRLFNKWTFVCLKRHQLPTKMCFIYGLSKSYSNQFSESLWI